MSKIKRTALVILALILADFLVGCVPKPKVVEIPVVEKVVVVEVVPEDTVPIEFMDPYWWDGFWEQNQEQFLAITFCFGKYGYLSQFSPLLPPSLKREGYLHERKHHDQIRRYGCSGMKEKYSTPEGILQIEAEAFFAQGLRGDSLVSMLADYGPLQHLGKDVIRELIKDLYDRRDTPDTVPVLFGHTNGKSFECVQVLSNSFLDQPGTPCRRWSSPTSIGDTVRYPTNRSRN